MLQFSLEDLNGVQGLVLRNQLHIVLLVKQVFNHSDLLSHQKLALLGYQTRTYTALICTHFLLGLTTTTIISESAAASNKRASESRDVAEVPREDLLAKLGHDGLLHGDVRGCGKLGGNLRVSLV